MFLYEHNFLFLMTLLNLFISSRISFPLFFFFFGFVSDCLIMDPVGFSE